MLPVDQVQQLVLDRVAVFGVEIIPWDQSLGRVLAEAIITPSPIPAWDNSAMDGYAVGSLTDEQFTVLEEIPAGRVPTQALQPGYGTRVMTGAMLPEGTVAVVMQEYTEILASGQVKLTQLPRPGQFMRRRGAFCQAGDELIKSGTRITAAEIGIFCSVNRLTIPVYRLPVVGILSTGDELIPAGQPLQPGQITDSNQPMLAALVQQVGAIPKVLGRVGDTPEALQAVLRDLEGVDWVISSGGVSVGSYDYVEQVLTALGADILVREVNMKPGKPLTFAQWGQRLYWGLPGNPMSSFVGFWLTVYPALRKALGYHQPWTLPEISAQLTAPLHTGGGRRHYVRGRYYWQDGFYFEPTGLDNSGNLANLSGVNGFAIVEGHLKSVAAGAQIPVLMLP